jgi:two-component system, cell cycle sensor histidine kinase and response regulator CckA
VLTAMDGNEAIRIAEGHKDLIHLLVTDIVMPNIGGSELAKRLQQVRPQMKVMFMSGYPDHPALPVGSLDSQSTVLQKPFSLDKLAHEVRSLLDLQ